MKQQQEPVVAPEYVNTSGNYRIKTSKNGMLKILVMGSWGASVSGTRAWSIPARKKSSV